MAPAIIGRIKYLNALPLFHGLEIPRTTFVDGTPTKLNRMLSTGALDIAMISTAEYLTRPEQYCLLPETCISARGRVGSVLLISTRPLEQLSGGVIALTTSSATSVVMLNAALTAHGVRNYSTVRSRPNARRMLQMADACLLIGDDALTFKPTERLFVYDIGTLWQQLTATPAVFAVLAARRAYAEQHPGRARAIAASIQKTAQRNLRRIAALPADRNRFPDLDLDAYFSLFGYMCERGFDEGILALSRYAAQQGIGSPLRRIPMGLNT